jgi:hypothetical protein
MLELHIECASKLKKVAKAKMLQQAKSILQVSKYSAFNKQSYLQVACTLCILTLLCASFGAYAENTSRIVKWKDEKGATHYGDKIPPQYVNRENSVINKQGVTVKHNKPINSQDQAYDLAKREQDKKDKALLGAFTNAEEIDLARDRNVQLDLIALDNLNQDKSNSLKRLAANKKLAEGFTKRKKAVPTDLNETLLNDQQEIVLIDQRIYERRQIIERTRQRFDADKKRYLQLKNPATPDASNLQPTTEVIPSQISAPPSKSGSSTR